MFHTDISYIPKKKKTEGESFHIFYGAIVSTTTKIAIFRHRIIDRGPNPKTKAKEREGERETKREIATWDLRNGKLEKEEKKGIKRYILLAQRARVHSRLGFCDTESADVFLKRARRPLFDTNTNFLPRRGKEKKK